MNCKKWVLGSLTTLDGDVKEDKSRGKEER